MESLDSRNTGWDVFLGSVLTPNKSPGCPAIWSDPFTCPGWDRLWYSKAIFLKGRRELGDPLDQLGGMVVFERSLFDMLENRLSYSVDGL